MKGLSGFDWITVVLTLIGGLNWGLVGFFQYNLVESILGDMTMTGTRVIYALVGLSALYLVFAVKGFSRK